jgi:hypothetical protein
MDASDAAAPPVFVGGTGRSGTTIVAQTIAAHPAYRLIGRELRFHADPGGLRGLLSGELDVAGFRAQLADFWLPRLAAACERDVLERAVARFEQPGDDVWAASRSLLEAVAGGAGGWVEMSPPNMEAAAVLARLLPEARFVHVVRSGLDVAVSYRAMTWAPDDLAECLLWWEDRLRRADAGLREVPAGRVLVVHLEELAGDGAPVRALLDFLRLEDDAGDVARYVAETVRPERMEMGRRELSAVERQRLERLYRGALGRLRRRGVHALPADAEGFTGPAGARAAWAHARWRVVGQRRWNWRRPRWRPRAARVRDAVLRHRRSRP